MPAFIGDIKGKVDTKGRVVVPSAFVKKMDAKDAGKFVIKKDIFANCLVLYPMSEWERQVDVISRNINPYNRQHNLFMRQFFKDAVEVEMDSLNRILIPKNMLVDVDIKKDIVFIGEVNKIEMWNPDALNQSSISQEDFAKLAEDIFKKLDKNDE